MARLIFDTDIDTDCDDTGALAIMHNFARRGEVEPLGVICSIPKRACALCAAAINTWYGREDLPIGLVRVADWEMAPRFAAYRGVLRKMAEGGKPSYNEVIGSEHEREHPGLDFPDAAATYRRLLAGAPANSVTICAVGTLTALEQLLVSRPDDISPLAGKALIAAKVDRLVTMALGTYPAGRDGFNWRMDTIGAATVLNGWPRPITVSELGTEVYVGPRFISAAPEDHPVRRAFEIWLGNWGQPQGRPSWDQVALIRAVRGCGELFDEHGGLGLQFDAETGEHEWIHGNGTPDRSWLEAQVPNEELARVVEDLMIESLGPSPRQSQGQE
jgi:hypothetical protein